MDRWQAQDTFWNSFGVPACDQNTVIDDLQLPYITYAAVSASCDVVVQTTANLWYYGKSWAEISCKSDEMAKKIREAPPAIKIDDGWLKIRLPSGMAFAQRLDDPNDENIRRMVLNVEMEFLTAY